MRAGGETRAAEDEEGESHRTVVGRWGEPSSSLGPLRSVGGFVAATVCALGSAWLGSLVGLGLALLLMAALMPLARDLGRRLQVGFVWFASVVGAASLVPGFPTTSGAITGLSLGTAAVVVLLAHRDGWPAGVPRVHSDELVVVLGSVLVVVVLVLPVRSGEPELGLLDASMAWDNLPHFQSMALLLVDGARIPSYEYGFHHAGALLAGVRSHSADEARVLSLMDYEFIRLAFVSLCALVLGFMAVEAGRAFGNGDVSRARRAAIVTSVAFLVSAPLAGLFGAFSLLGHGNFLWAVTAVTVASWLSLDPRMTGFRAGLMLSLGVVAAFSSYRSVQVGMAAAVVLVAKAALDRREVLSVPARWALSLGAGAVVFVGWVPLHFQKLSQTVALTGSHVSDGASVAIPALTVLVNLGLLLGLGLILLRRHPELQGVMVRAMAPLAGLGVFAVALAVQISRLESPLDNYFVWKSASALTIAGYPAVLALATAAFMPAALGSGLAWWVRLTVPVVAVVTVLVVLPSAGRAPSFLPSGLQVLDLRLRNLEGMGASGSGVHRASQMVGPEAVAAIALPDESWGWSHRPESSTLWLNALRGVPTSAANLEAADCVRYSAWTQVEACLLAWGRDHPGQPLILVDLDDRVPAEPDLPDCVSVIGDPRLP